MSQIANYAQISDAQAQRLVREIQPLQTLEDLIRWGVQHEPARVILEVVVQDEYCHDVVIEWEEGLFLAFDTT